MYIRKILGILLFFMLSSCRLLSPPDQGKQPTETPTDKSPLEQTEPKKPKAKLGLFISGAGANTFASLPILELIQQKGWQFEVVAGSGWGAWLASLYSKNQSVSDLKWNLLKLKQQGVFGTKWFGNKKKRVRILRGITEGFLTTPLSSAFVCPVVGKTPLLLHTSTKEWTAQHASSNLNTPLAVGFTLKERPPASAVLNCLQGVPPLFFAFYKKAKKGSLFSAGPLLQYLQAKVDRVLWIKTDFSLKPVRREPAFYLFWQELLAYLNTQKEILQKQGKVVIIEIKNPSYAFNDFSNLSALIKAAKVPAKAKKQIQNLTF